MAEWFNLLSVQTSDFKFNKRKKNKSAYCPTRVMFMTWQKFILMISSTLVMTCACLQDIIKHLYQKWLQWNPFLTTSRTATTVAIKTDFAIPRLFLYLSHTIYSYNNEYKKSLSSVIIGSLARASAPGSARHENSHSLLWPAVMHCVEWGQTVQSFVSFLRSPSQLCYIFWKRKDSLIERCFSCKDWWSRTEVIFVWK